MTIADVLPRFLEWIGGMAVAMAALSWLTKSILSHWLSKDIKSYKAALKHDTEMQIEDFKSRLQIFAKEREVRFSKLHEKRAETIAHLYSLIGSANIAVELFQRVLTLRDKGEVNADAVEDFEMKAHQATRLLFDYVENNQLYFGEKLAKQLKDLMFAIQKPITDLEIHRIRGKNSAEAGSLDHREITESWNQEKAQIRKTMTMIETEFRKMLGSENP